jgi:hypothetical protein
MAGIFPLNVLLTGGLCGGFLQQSLRSVYPDLAEQAVLSVVPSHLSSGKGRFDLFQVAVEFENRQTRSLLIFASRESVLSDVYETIAVRDPEHESAHRFGAKCRGVVPVEGSSAEYHLFSVDYHEGVPLAAATELLEGLVGVPGLDSRSSLPRIDVGRMEGALGRLVGMGLLTDGEKEGIMEARRAGKIVALLEGHRRLRDLLFQLDQEAIRAYFRFYQKTGYTPGDPRRQNMIFQVVDGRRVFKPIDYEHMKETSSPWQALLAYYAVFERRPPEGAFVERGVRPWVWSFLDDKSGFFEAVLEAFGEEEGLKLLSEAVAEGRSATNPTSLETDVFMHLAAFLIKRGALQEGRDDRIVRSTAAS